MEQPESRQRSQMAVKQQTHPTVPTVEFAHNVKLCTSSVLKKYSNYLQKWREKARLKAFIITY